MKTSPALLRHQQPCGEMCPRTLTSQRHYLNVTPLTPQRVCFFWVAFAVMHPLNFGQYQALAFHTALAPQRITRHLVIRSNSTPGMRFARGRVSRLGSFVIAVKITPLEMEREKRSAANCGERDSILGRFDVMFKHIETGFISDGESCTQWVYWKILGKLGL